MIITREVSVKINQSNFHYFESLGYDPSVGTTLIIPIELLSSGSHQRISCQCDGCGKINDVIYKNYLKYGNKWGNYFCRKCSEEKRKRTLNLNHGVDYPIQNKQIKEKIIKAITENKKKG